MTQEEVDFLFNVTIVIHDSDWFGKRKKPRNRNEAQEWVTKQLAERFKVYTIPYGMSWGQIVDKERYDEYWKENSKLKE